MKKYMIIGFMLGVCIFTLPVYAQDKNKNDLIVLAVKIKELQLKKVSLERLITVEDKKRNQHEPGISPERQEILNDRQDSICLELRSKLVSVELELKELTSKK